MIIVSGCPRSGTSLMMDSLRLALGDDRILGSEFPSKNKLHTEKTENESDELHHIRKYLISKVNVENEKRNISQTKDMNPNGFFECRYSVRGINYHVDMSKKTEDKNMVCKIVSNGLLNSDPKYIDKVIYMLRNPREVAKSQERLSRELPKEDLDKLGKVHTPELFIQSSESAAIWFNENKSVSVLVIDYENLLSNPDREFLKVKSFIGEGDFSNHPVDKSLHRSKPEEMENDLWEQSNTVFCHIKNNDFDSVFQISKDTSRRSRRVKSRFVCPRSGLATVYNQCKICYSDKPTMHNLRAIADKKKIGWKKEPCVFECGLSFDLKPKTIDESILNNFWDDGESEEIDLKNYKGCCS